MEIILQWFWLVKLALISFTLYIGYLAIVKHKLANKFYNILFLVLIVFSLVQPFKLDVDTKSHTDRTNRYIEQSKQLPPKVENNHFKESNNLNGISKKDIWEK